MENNINFGWRFVEGFLPTYLKELPKNSSIVDIPHAPVEVPVSYFDEKIYQKIFTYEKLFDIPTYEPNQVINLTFEGVMLKFHLYCNGTDFGEFISGWVPVTIDISKVAKPTSNRLVVVVDGREDPSIPPFGKAVDYLTFAGIYRPVKVENLPQAYLKSLHINATKNGNVSITYSTSEEGKKAKLTFKVFDGSKLLITSSKPTFVLPGIRVWSVDTPNLYRLEASLETKTTVHKKSINFGFRDAKFTSTGFYLNGEKIKLIGLNRHQNYPYVGPAMPESAQKEDADIIKYKYGCNIVRTSHYPQSEDFLKHCDEIGLLVVDEIPGWQYIGQDKAWRKNFYYFERAMIEKEQDHPSLIAYGTRIDESLDDKDLYTKATQIAHEMDPYRQTLGVRNFKTSSCLEDIYAYNDFSCASSSHGLDNPKSIKGAKGKPLLISEHNGHMYVTKQFDAVSRRLENALRHLRVIDDAYKYDDLSGAIGWCAFDYYTHADFGSGDHICHHGVADMFRNPKASAFAYASQLSNLPIMWVANPPLTGDNDEALLKPLYVLTNCDYVELYKNDVYINTFTPDKKLFPHLPHAPIVIDDFIGSSFKEEGISSKDALKIVKALNLVGREGIAHLGAKDLLPFIPAILHSKLNMDRLYSFYGKYVAGWGEKSSTYTLKGYKEGKLVNEKKYGNSTKFFYRYEVSKQHLINDKTYDVARVSIKFVDEFGTQEHYANRILSFKTFGPLEVIGPKVVAMDGGDISVYVRSKETSSLTRARLVIDTDEGEDNLEFSVS
jgi:beta-galactosidase